MCYSGGSYPAPTARASRMVLTSRMGGRLLSPIFRGTTISFTKYFTFQPLKLLDLKTFCNFVAMKVERTISAYKNYFRDFISSLTEAETRKVFYVIDMLKTQERVMPSSSNTCATRSLNFVPNMAATSSGCFSFSMMVMW